MKLTAQQKLDYDINGFLVLPGFVPDSKCDELIAEAERLVDAFEPGEIATIFSTRDQERVSNQYFLDSADRISFFFEPGAFAADGKLVQAKNISINKIGHALHDLNPVFDSFSRQPGLAEIAQDLNYKDPLLLQSMYIFKQPFIGGEVTCHQDGTFLYTDPMSVTGFWFALQDATVDNGCLYVLPGGHKTSLRRRYCRDGNGKVAFEELDTTPFPEMTRENGYVPLEAKKGSLVLLHGLVPHLSAANTSPYSRHAYTLHILEGDTHYPSENWLQRRPEFPARGF